MRPNYSVADEKDLILAGFLAFSDPPLPDAVEALAKLRREGVQVKIITSDGDLVSVHVCSQVGLESGKIVLGDEIERMTDAALTHVAEQTTVFARVSPAQKNRILLALKHRGHVVGFMGDGINDAPSLHAADVGISVSTAVDVAREAADIILVEPGLNVLAIGILEGRKAFGNVMKYLLMGTSSNFGNMFSMAAASVFLPFLPMLATQILLNNFLYDASQLAIPTDNVDADLLLRPRRWKIDFIRNFMVVMGPISSIFDFLTFAILLYGFHAFSNQALFQTGWFVESLATQTVVVFIIRTAGNPFKSLPSIQLTAAVAAIVLLSFALPYTYLGKHMLGFVPLHPLLILAIIGLTIIYLALVQMVKVWFYRKNSLI